MDWTTGAALIVVEIGALAGALWAMMRVVKGVRSDIAGRVEEAVTLRRDIDEIGRRLDDMAKRSASDHEAIRGALSDAADSRREVHREISEIERRLVDLRGDVRVIRARIDAHGVNGGGRHAA